MHLLIPFAAPLSEAGQHALPRLSLPNLEALLARWAHGARDDGDETSLSPPHERARARALGLHGKDGLLPWAAFDAAMPADGRAWGWMTPACWQVGTDQVSMLDPALLELGEADSRALFDAVRPLLAEDGFELAWQTPLQWRASHPDLARLPTASLDRVIGRNVEHWLPPKGQAGPARLLRRLQNEVQMLLYGHAVNEAREARGQLAVNSFWLSGCGPAQAAAQADASLHIDDRLRTPALADDWGAWLAAWQTLDAGPIARLLETPQPARLTLCGERASIELAARPPSLRQRLHLAPRRMPAAALLNTL